MLGIRIPTLPSFLDSGAVYRFLRAVLAAGLAAVTGALVEYLGLLELPEYAYPVVLALFMALDKFIRDRYGS